MDPVGSKLERKSTLHSRLLSSPDDVSSPQEQTESAKKAPLKRGSTNSDFLSLEDFWGPNFEEEEERDLSQSQKQLEQVSSVKKLRNDFGPRWLIKEKALSNQPFQRGDGIFTIGSISSLPSELLLVLENQARSQVKETMSLQKSFKLKVEEFDYPASLERRVQIGKLLNVVPFKKIYPRPPRRFNREMLSASAPALAVMFESYESTLGTACISSNRATLDSILEYLHQNDLKVLIADKKAGLVIMTKSAVETMFESWREQHKVRRSRDWSLEWQQEYLLHFRQQILDCFRGLSGLKDLMIGFSLLEGIEGQNTQVPLLHAQPKVMKLDQHVSSLDAVELIKMRPIEVMGPGTIGRDAYKWAAALLQGVVASLKHNAGSLYDFRQSILNVQLNPNYWRHCVFFKWDAKDMFTNMKKDQMLESLEYYIVRLQSLNKIGDGQVFKAVLRLVMLAFGQKTLVYNNVVYEYDNGVAMGNPLASACANIYNAQKEEKAVDSINFSSSDNQDSSDGLGFGPFHNIKIGENILGPKIAFSQRYTDDQFGIGKDMDSYLKLKELIDEIFHPLVLSWEFSEMDMEFLDLQIYKGPKFAQTGQLNIRLRKKERRFSHYKRYDDSPGSSSWLYAEYKRIYHSFTDNKERDLWLADFEDYLQTSCAFPSYVLEQVRDRYKLHFEENARSLLLNKVSKRQPKWIIDYATGKVSKLGLQDIIYVPVHLPKNLSPTLAKNWYEDLVSLQKGAGPIGSEQRKQRNRRYVIFMEEVAKLLQVSSSLVLKLKTFAFNPTVTIGDYMRIRVDIAKEFLQRGEALKLLNVYAALDALLQVQKLQLSIVTKKGPDVALFLSSATNKDK
jgi:hypothetical protein